MNTKSRLLLFGLVFVLLGLSLTSGPVMSNTPQKIAVNQTNNYLQMYNSSMEYYDYDGDSYYDAFTIYFLLNGTPDADVHIGINIYDTLRNYMSLDYKLYYLTLNSSGLAIFDFTFLSNFTSRYEFDFYAYIDGDGYTYTNYWFTVYLDGNGMEWIPEPNVNVMSNVYFSDNDGDGFNDTVLYEFTLEEQQSPAYIQDITVNFTYHYYYGAYYYEFYDQFLGHAQIQNNSFVFDFQFMANDTGNYDLNFQFADQYGRIVSYYYDYLSKFDGYGDEYVDYDVYGWCSANATVSNGSSVIDSLGAYYNFQYYPGLINTNDVLTLKVEVWALGEDWYYDFNNNVVVGTDGYFVSGVKYNVTLSNESIYIEDYIEFLLSEARNYLLVYTIYNPDTGFVWVNCTDVRYVPVGIPEGMDPFSVYSVVSWLEDINNDTEMDSIYIEAIIESFIYANITLYYYLEVYYLYPDNVTDYIYGDQNSVSFISPTNFTISAHYTAKEEGDFLVKLYLETYPYMDNPICVYDDVVHLSSGESQTTTSTSSSSSSSSSTTQTSTTNTTSTSNQTSSTSTQETSPSDTNSTTPELPLPLSFTSVVLGLGSASMLMIIVKRRR